jgi:HEAT repeat protein
VENYLSHVRRLLTQDISPVVTESVATTVVERIMTLADPADPVRNLLSNRRSEPTESSSSPLFNSSQHTEGSSLSSSSNETDTAQKDEPNPLLIHSNLAATRYTLSLPFTSIYSCAGAAYSLARLGVYDDKTVDQLIDYLLVYPQPLRRLPLKDGSFGFIGNSCLPTNPDFGDVQPSEPLPSVLEQLVIFKTGAIEALGAIESHGFQDVRIVFRDEERGIADGKVDRVLTYLVRIANLEVFAPDFPEIPKCLKLASPDNTNSGESDDCDENDPKKVEIRLDHDSEIVQGLGEFNFSPEQIHLAQQLGLTPDDIREIRRTQGLVAVEVLQAAKWGLTPQEFFDLKLQIQESAIAAIGQLALHPDGQAAIDALNPELSGDSSSEIITGQSSRGIRGLSTEEIKALKIENLGVILQAFQNFSRNNNHIRSYINRNDDIVIGYLISELDLDKSQYEVKPDINYYFIKDSESGDPTEIDNNAINTLTENLAQEVRQIASRYLREINQVDANIRTEFPNLSDAQLRERVKQRKKELRRDYTRKLQDRAVAILRSEERFQDKALRILVDLRTETIQSLNFDTRTKLIEQLGVTSNLNILDPNAPQLIAQRCLNDPDIFDRERFCHGLARLISAALTGKNGGTVSSENVDASINLLRTLAGDPRASDPIDEGQINNNPHNNNLSRSSSADNNPISANTTPVIQRSAIEYLGSLNSLGLGINSSNQFHSLLLARSVADNEPGVIETSVATYLTMPPEVGVDELTKTLLTGDAQQAAAIQMVARLGQVAYSNDDYDHWRTPLQNERLIEALVTVAQNNDFKTDAISAIGHTRTNNEAAIDLLRETLTNPGPLERRIAAAHALGNIISTQGMIVDGLDDELRNIVINRQEPSELRVVAAYTLSKFDDNRGINALSQEQRVEIAYSIISLYEDAQETVPTGNDWLISPNTQKAMILYALSQIEIDEGIASRAATETHMSVRNLIDRIGKIYADALGEDNPIAVRAMAATYAHNIPLWNEELVNALIAAFEDPNLAVRYAAIESVRIRPEGALGNLVYPDRPSPEGRLFEALNTVFWDEREYAFVRLRAGLALDDQQEYRVEGVGDRYPKEPDDPFIGAISTTTLFPENQEFVDMLNALKALDENSIGFRTSSSDAILQALRSAELLAAFDDLDNIDEALLLDILEAIRPGSGTFRDIFRRIFGNN